MTHDCNHEKETNNQGNLKRITIVREQNLFNSLEWAKVWLLVSSLQLDGPLELVQEVKDERKKSSRNLLIQQKQHQIFIKSMNQVKILLINYHGRYIFPECLSWCHPTFNSMVLQPLANLMIRHREKENRENNNSFLQKTNTMTCKEHNSTLQTWLRTKQ